MIRILLVDDQNLVQQGIKSLLADDPDLEIVGTLKDGRSAVNKVAELSPDVVLLDIEMPGMDGITATKYITRLAPQTKVIILSSHEDKKYLTQALMAGARAYLLKNSLVKDLKQSIIAVNNGYSQMESRLLAKIFHPSNLKSNNRQKTIHQDQQPRRLDDLQTARSTTSKAQATIQPAAQTKIQPEAQVTVAQQTTPSREKSVMLTDSVKEDSASDTVALSQPSSNDYDVVYSGSADGAYKSQSRFGTEDSDSKADRPNSFEEQPLDQRSEQAPSFQGGVISDLKPISTVPKINLAHSELEHFATAPMESSRELAEVRDIATNQTLPNAAVQHSALQLSTTKQSLKVPVKSKKFSPLIAQYQGMVAQVWASQSLRHQPLINRCQAQIAQYKYQLSPLRKQLQKKGWLTNAGLALLGLIAVIIISQMFS